MHMNTKNIDNIFYKASVSLVCFLMAFILFAQFSQMQVDIFNTALLYFSAFSMVLIMCIVTHKLYAVFLNEKQIKKQKDKIRPLNLVILPDKEYDNDAFGKRNI